MNSPPATARSNWWPVTQVVIAASLWGFSGIAAQQLFRHSLIQPIWLASVRVLGAGVLLGLWSQPHHRLGNLRRFVRSRGDVVRLVLFSVIALDGVQLTFFFAIAHGTAVSATLLQFTSPLLILGWYAFRHRRIPPLFQLVVVVVAVVGVATVVTNGSLTGLVIPLSGIVWGLIAAVLTGFYNVMPVRLLSKHDAAAVVAAAFLLGSVVLSPWLIIAAPSRVTPGDLGLVAFVIVGGTAVPFLMYLSSLKRLHPVQANVVGALEPIAAAIGSIFFLGLVPTWALGVGGVLVLGAIVALSHSGSTSTLD
ncbi:MAG: EamA family transporter [Ferrimicrobium sp.]